MAVTEHGRFVLYEHFEADMGEEKARILMDHLLPMGWTDLATKQDLQATKQELLATKQELKADIAAVGHEIKELRLELTAELHKSFTTHTQWLIGFMIGLQGLMLAALKLF